MVFQQRILITIWGFDAFGSFDYWMHQPFRPWRAMEIPLRVYKVIHLVSCILYLNYASPLPASDNYHNSQGSQLIIIQGVCMSVFVCMHLFVMIYETPASIMPPPSPCFSLLFSSSLHMLSQDIRARDCSLILIILLWQWLFLS